MSNHGQNLLGKIAVITGGSGGVGLYATAKLRGRRRIRRDHWATRRERGWKEAAAFIKRNVTTVVGGDVTLGKIWTGSMPS